MFVMRGGVVRSVSDEGCENELDAIHYPHFCRHRFFNESRSSSDVVAGPA